jgi:hypothetical protein
MDSADRLRRVVDHNQTRTTPDAMITDQLTVHEPTGSTSVPVNVRIEGTH